MAAILHLGLGDIGKNTIRSILAQGNHHKLVGVVDISPTFAGKSLRSVMPDAPNIPISSSIKEALKSAKQRPEVATITTCSQTVQIRQTLEELIDARIHAVASCEELAFPNLRSKKVAEALDARARKKKVAILATGVNPGFAMDAFALACTAPCTTVKHIKVIRHLDASKRRLQLQKKIGAGMKLAEVNRLIKNNAIGHVGLKESVAMIAHGLGWKLDDIREKFTAIRADHRVNSEYIHIEAGEVRGLHMVAAGIMDGKKRIELDLVMAFDSDTFDEVIIDGDPPLLVRTKSGFPGEASTVGLLVNCIRVAPTLEPGVRTMLDVLRVRSVGA
jgi:4-hydroxy-tetrahydrodipicolinate reductase